MRKIVMAAPYFEIGDDGEFAYDKALNFDPTKKYVFKPFAADAKWPVSVKGWPSEEIDISDIPPTLFLMAVINTYSTINAMYIPFDMSIADFSKKMRKDMVKYFSKDKNGCGGTVSYLFDPIREVMAHLHDTCRIRPDKWNYTMKEQGHIHTHIFEEGVRTQIGAIEAIVSACRSELARV